MRFHLNLLIMIVQIIIKNLNESYTEYIINLKTNILIIKYYVYMKMGDPNSKYIIDWWILNMSSNENIQQFFLYLYQKYKNMNNIPKTRL